MDEFYFADGVMVKTIFMPDKHGRAVGHKHSYDHTTFVVPGSTVRAWRDGELMGDYIGPAGLLIKAGCFHEFQSLSETAMLLCIHNTHGIPAEELEGALVIERHPQADHV